jgi:predicted TIM-barrel fold metal-dependent hydrolase
MLHTHGSRHILFGTDWPWLFHTREIKRIDVIMEKAGFGGQEKEAVFGRNLEKMLGLLDED